MGKKIIGIWAQTENEVIGKDQVMPWHLPAELQHFKETTMGQAIVMGRVTFEGMQKRVLPGRTSIVLTSDLQYDPENDQVLVFTSKKDILDWFSKQDKDLYIIGGKQVLSLFENDLEEIVQTIIHTELDGDTFAPRLDLSGYQKIAEKSYSSDEKNSYDFTIHSYRRKDRR